MSVNATAVCCANSFATLVDMTLGKRNGQSLEMKSLNMQVNTITLSNGKGGYQPLLLMNI
jgi:hypothetical protein